MLFFSLFHIPFPLLCLFSSLYYCRKLSKLASFGCVQWFKLFYIDWQSHNQESAGIVLDFGDADMKLGVFCWNRIRPRTI